MFKTNCPEDSLQPDFTRFWRLYFLIFQEVEMSNFCIPKKLKILYFKPNWFHVIRSSTGYLKQIIFRTCPECTADCTVLVFQFSQGANEVQVL